MPAKQKVVTGEDLEAILEGVRNFAIDHDFLEAAYADVQAFRDTQRERG